MLGIGATRPPTGRNTHKTCPIRPVTDDKLRIVRRAVAPVAPYLGLVLIRNHKVYFYAENRDFYEKNS